MIDFSSINKSYSEVRPW